MEIRNNLLIFRHMYSKDKTVIRGDRIDFFEIIYDFDAQTPLLKITTNEGNEFVTHYDELEELQEWYENRP